MVQYLPTPIFGIKLVARLGRLSGPQTSIKLTQALFFELSATFRFSLQQICGGEEKAAPAISP
ncbi:MAG: hypothetical protein A3G25_02045 [Betaproteobacteria bacterium RIFCSPLOWO2_12_FULL_63_13]|nr:MAG: hypothetical protein A3H32_18245 [Betaproteobacteria bacterium RIFCSPLOWO2_02_FULL_63_19]OGA50548.1 MAG: hypothetical protein A3G25_02045 [Betaproteobacteria bacterium RIFCSPLOWO2_12_FULL_63_13]